MDPTINKPLCDHLMGLRPRRLMTLINICGNPVFYYKVRSTLIGSIKAMLLIQPSIQKAFYQMVKNAHQWAPPMILSFCANRLLEFLLSQAGVGPIGTPLHAFASAAYLVVGKSWVEKCYFCVNLSRWIIMF